MPHFDSSACQRHDIDEGWLRTMPRGADGSSPRQQAGGPGIFVALTLHPQATTGIPCALVVAPLPGTPVLARVTLGVRARWHLGSV